MPMLDRKYSGDEIGEIAARATTGMGDLPGIVKLAAHVAAAATLLEEAMAHETPQRPLSADFHMALRALRASAALFLLVCQTGPVSAGTKQ